MNKIITLSNWKWKKKHIFDLALLCLVLTTIFTILYQSNFGNIVPSYSCSECETGFDENILSEKDLGRKIIVQKRILVSKGLTFVTGLDNLDFNIYRVENVEEAKITLWKEGVNFVVDQKMHSSMLNGKELMGLGSSTFLEAKGRTFAVLDTGINIQHETFVKEQLLCWKDFVGESSDLEGDLYVFPEDKNGHGTAVTSIIAGNKTTNSIMTYVMNVNPNSLKFISQVELENNHTLYIKGYAEEIIKVQFGLYDLEKEEIYYISDVYNGQEFGWNYTFCSSENETARYMAFVANPSDVGTIHIEGNLSYPILYEYSGVCPGAKFVSIKVLDDRGEGYLSHFLEGLDYLLQIKDEYNISVVNLSLGFEKRIAEVDEAIKKVTNEGIVVVCSAGNGGTVEDIKSPGASSEAITVGSINRDKHVAYYSSHGCYCPLRDVKPDVLAFGGSSSERYLKVKGASTTNNSFEGVEGTSFSTAFISGIALYLTSLQEWNYTWEQVKEIKFKILMSTYETFLGETFNGDGDFAPQEPTIDYFMKDRIEGWGAYYFSQIDHIQENEKVTFSLNRTNNPLKIFKFNTSEKTSYFINIESDSYVVTNIVNSMDMYGNPVQLVESTPEKNVTYMIEGNNKTTYIVVKALQDTNAITLSYKLDYQPILNITSELPERVTNSKEASFSFEYFNGEPQVMFDGIDITEKREADGAYVFENLNDGEHQIKITVTNKKTMEKVEFSYSWYVDTQAPLIYWNCPENNSIIKEESLSIEFQLSDIHLVEYVKLVLNNSKNVQTILEDEPEELTFSFSKKFNTRSFENRSTILFTLYSYDSAQNVLVNYMSFNIEYYTYTSSNQTNTTIPTEIKETSYLSGMVGMGVTSLFSLLVQVKKHKKTERGK